MNWSIFCVDPLTFCISFVICMIIVIIWAFHYIINEGKKRSWVVVGNSQRYYDKDYDCYRYRTKWKRFLYKGILHAFNKLKNNKVEIGLYVVELRYGKEKLDFNNLFNSSNIINSDYKGAAGIILSKIQKYNNYKREIKLYRQQIRSLGEVVEIF